MYVTLVVNNVLKLSLQDTSRYMISTKKSIFVNTSTQYILWQRKDIIRSTYI